MTTSSEKCKRCGGFFLQYADDEVKCACCGRYRDIEVRIGIGHIPEKQGTRYTIVRGDTYISDIMPALAGGYEARWSVSVVDSLMWDARQVAEAWAENLPYTGLDVVLLPKGQVKTILDATAPKSESLTSITRPGAMKTRKSKTIRKKAYPWTKA